MTEVFMPETIESVESLRVVGRFTAAEVDAADRRAGWLQSALSGLRSGLQQRRAAAAAGDAEAEADLIERALTDSVVVDALQAYVDANRRHKAAERDVRRCRSRYGRSMTDLARERYETLRAAERYLDEKRQVMDEALRSRGHETVRRLVTVDLMNLAGLRHKAESLRASCREGDLPQRIAETESELEQRLRFRDVLRAHQVTDDELRTYAASLTTKQRALLVKLAGGYEPKRTTVQKHIDDYRPLHRIGLVEERHRTAGITPIGKDVASFIERAGPEEGLGIVRGRRDWSLPMSRFAIRAAFTSDEWEALQERVRAALERADEDPAEPTIELGDPARGFSYRVVRDREALLHVSWLVLGTKPPEHVEPDIPLDKLPRFEPGRFIDENGTEINVGSWMA